MQQGPPPSYLQTMYLTKGATAFGGSQDANDGASWMQALNWYEDAGESWSEQPISVCPLIRECCIQLNNALPDEERGTLIGPHLWTPLGTISTPEVELARAYLCVNRSLLVWARDKRAKPFYGEHWEKMQGLETITSSADALAAGIIAWDAACEADIQATQTYNSGSIRYIDRADAAYVCAAAAKAAYGLAKDDPFNAAAFTALAGARYSTKELLKLILEMCDMGKRLEIGSVKSRDEVLEEVCMVPTPLPELGPRQGEPS